LPSPHDRRRFLLTSLAGALAAPRVAQGQQTKVARIGIVSFGHRPAPGSTPDPNEGFRHGLRELGYEEGRSIILEYRYAEQQSDRLSGLIADLIRMSVDVLHVGGPEVVRAALSATTTIPIVMVSGGDPVVEGQSRAWPALVETSLGSPSPTRRSLGSAWSC
jgi:putative ABC transport system substrate-binding protein